MVDLLELMSSQLMGDDAVERLSRRIGADHGATRSALEGALPMLLGGLSRNVEQHDGATALASALDRDHGGDLLDDLTGFLTGGGGDAGILRHVFGGRQPAVEQSLSRASGLDSGQIGQLLAMAAPAVLAVLGRVKRQQGYDAAGMADILRGTRRSMETRQPDAMRSVLNLLDADGDGSIADDLSNLGSGLLGSLLRGGR